MTLRQTDELTDQLRAAIAGLIEPKRAEAEPAAEAEAPTEA